MIMWVRLNPAGEWSNPHTGGLLTEPAKFTLLRAIKGHAGSEPEKGIYVCLGKGRFLGIHPNSGGTEAEHIMDTEEFCRSAWAVVNGGYAYFATAGNLEF
jgi:hypothetical protein